MISDIFIYLIYYLTSLFGCYTIGSLFLHFTGLSVKPVFTGIFTKVSVGLVTFTVLTALFFSKGISILSGFLLLGSALLYYTQKEKIHHLRGDENAVKPLRIILSILIPALLFFFWEAFFNFSFDTFHYVVAPRDYHHYSDISEALMVNGQENTFGLKNNLDPGYQGIIPYHYFELWLNGGISSIFHCINAVSLMNITFPLLYTVSFLGFCAIWEQSGQLSILKYIASFAFIAFGGVLVDWYTSIPYIGQGSFITIYPIDTYTRKYAVYYIFVIGAWLFFKNQKDLSGILLLLCIPLVSAGATPGILSGLMLCSIIQFFTRSNERKLIFRQLFFTMLTGIFILSIYGLFKADIEVSNFKEVFLKETWVNSSSYKTMFNIVVLSTAQYGLYYLPFILIISYFYRNSFKNKAYINPKLILAVSIYIAAILSWALLYYLGNANQFFSNSIAIILNVWIIGWVVQIHSNKPKSTWVLPLVILLIIPNFYYAFNRNTRTQEYADTFLEKVNEAINSLPQEEIYGAVLFSKSETEKLTGERQKALHIYPLAHYTNYNHKKVTTINLSVFDVPEMNDELNERRFKYNVEMTLFFRYVQKQKSNNTFSSLKDSQLSFILDQHLNYVVIRKGLEIPKELDPYTERIISDNLSGDRFLLLRSF